MRLNRLDILRAVAVFLVLGRHLYVSDLWMRVGWVGVDLFFVLSGFLVSGLLFSEYRRYGYLNPIRFWLRRGFKIYPPFYFLVCVSLVFGIRSLKGSVVSEVLFLQSYTPGLWHHTWSLAVEEHFYLILPIGLTLLARARRGRGDPFVRLPLVIAAVAVLLLGLRVVGFMGMEATGQVYFYRHLYPTHLRLDSLLFGVLIAYLFHCRSEPLLWLSQRGRTGLLALAGLSLLAIAPCAWFEVDSMFMCTIGLSALYLGFGGLLVVCLMWPTGTGMLAWPPVAAAARALGFVGRHSYSIYLWHLPMKMATVALLARVAPDAPVRLVFAAYFVVTVLVGVMLARMIEGPALRLRDRWLPSRSAALPSVPAMQAPLRMEGAVRACARTPASISSP